MNSIFRVLAYVQRTVENTNDLYGKNHLWYHLKLF